MGKATAYRQRIEKGRSVITFSKETKHRQLITINLTVNTIVKYLIDISQT